MHFAFVNKCSLKLAPRDETEETETAAAARLDGERTLIGQKNSQRRLNAYVARGFSSSSFLYSGEKGSWIKAARLLNVVSFVTIKCNCRGRRAAESEYKSARASESC